MEGLTVSAPRWLSLSRILDVVAGKSEWISARLTRFEATRSLLNADKLLPQVIALPALEENWQVAYRQAPGVSVSTRTIPPDTLLVSGAVDESRLCTPVLRRWLARRAKEVLGPWLETLAAETGLHFSRLTIRNQRTRWGSCSATGSISLNCKLLFLPPDLVRYVLLHELCHTREHNHTARYWSLLLQHEPKARTLHHRIRAAWHQIPAWAHPVRSSKKQ